MHGTVESHVRVHGSNLFCVDWLKATNLHAKNDRQLHSLPTLVLLNVFELILSVDHVRFVHDLVLALAVNDLLQPILGG